MPDSPKKMTRAEEIFVSSLAMTEMKAIQPVLPFRLLYKFVTDPDFSLTHEQQAVLFSSQRLRKDYQRLKQDLSILKIPKAAAAASEGTVTKRKFSGGEVEVLQSKIEHLYYIIVRLTDSNSKACQLHIENVAGEMAKLALKTPKGQGVFRETKDIRNEDDERLVRLLTDPEMIGEFL